jgi:hypothetical protein
VNQSLVIVVVVHDRSPLLFDAGPWPWATRFTAG